MTIDDASTTLDNELPPVADDKPDRRPGSAPGWLVWSMIVLASVIAIGSALNTWVDRQLLDTDNWVAATDELLVDPDVRAALSVYLVDELYANVDVKAELTSRLPEQLAVLAGPLSTTLQGSADKAVDRLLATQPAQDAWSKANRVTHEALVRVLKDETRDGVSTADGVVTLQLGTLVADLGSQLGVPKSVLDRIPPDAGTIVVAEADELRQAQQAVQVVEVLSVVLFFVVLVLYVAAVFFASDRRRALRNVGWSLVVSGFVLLLGRWLAVTFVDSDLESAKNLRSAVHAAAIIATGIVGELAWAGIAIGALIAFYAILTGPSNAAIGIRRSLAPVFSNRLTAYLVAIAIVGLLAFITPGTTIKSWWVGLTFLILVLWGVERLRSLVRRDNPDASFAVVWDETKQKLDGKSTASRPATSSPPATVSVSSTDAADA